MASVNKVIIIGNLGRDPEARTFPNGDMVANVTIATTDKWKDKQTDEMKEHTEWHRVVFTRRLAEVANEYLRKGSQVYVEGSLRTRKWQDKDTGKDCYATEIRADVMQMLGSRQDGSGGQRHTNDDQQDRQRSGGTGDQQQRRSNDDQYQRGRDQHSYEDRDNGGRSSQGDRQQGDNRSTQRSQDNRGSQAGGQGTGDRSAQRRPHDDQRQRSNIQQQRANSGFDDMDDDIPF